MNTRSMLHMFVAHLSILVVGILWVVARIQVDAASGWPWVALDVATGLGIAAMLYVSVIFCSADLPSVDRVDR